MPQRCYTEQCKLDSKTISLIPSGSWCFIEMRGCLEMKISLSVSNTMSGACTIACIYSILSLYYDAVRAKFIILEVKIHIPTKACDVIVGPFQLGLFAIDLSNVKNVSSICNVWRGVLSKIKTKQNKERDAYEFFWQY